MEQGSGGSMQHLLGVRIVWGPSYRPFFSNKFHMGSITLRPWSTLGFPVKDSPVVQSATWRLAQGALGRQGASR